ncbi:hypothetical protein MSPP1_004060 [Malassezia sp. CBS 17886]|nr:hypothetical protein MSPP1_004060 [Malassezia sp. CBS 17886]
MGAQASSQVHEDAEDAFVDYYTLLEVEPTDTTDAIRRSYRKLALRLHPDKNPGQEADAQRNFVRLQEAYEVLSDDTERAWYDQNRDRLMHGAADDDADVEAKFQFFRTGGAAPRPASAAPGIGVAHLLRFHTPSLAKDFSDSDNSFFGTYRRLFERVAEEDRVAAPYPGEAHTAELADPDRDDAAWYPGFGRAATAYATGVRSFYQFWTSFSSRKSFVWKDKYDLRDAPDRRTRRLMEKENRRARDSARREYNGAIRALAAFVRRRDPRVKAHFAAQAAEADSEDAAARRRAEAERRQADKRAQAASFSAQSWQIAEEPVTWDSEFSSGEELQPRRAQQADGDESAEDSGADEILDDTLWDCVACNKHFQSQAAWDNHERSKKHRKEVLRLQREMREEDEAMWGGRGGAAVDALRSGAEDASTRADAHADSEASSVDAETRLEDLHISRKKDKKKKKRERHMRAALGQEAGAAGMPGEASGDDAPSPAPRAAPVRVEDTLPHLAQLPRLTTRPAGSFDVFGYGSLIFKPPPHVIGYTPGFIRGYVRRFAQHSVDHRGTPERPGRVVTLVSSELWQAHAPHEDVLDEDIVWGISYTIDPAYADEVRAYMDHREKNGYSALWEPIRGVADGVDTVLVDAALVYVGLPDNEAFVGAQPLDTLAAYIVSCVGPSGRNDEYLLRLAEAVRLLTPDSRDTYLFALEALVSARRAEEAGDGRGVGVGDGERVGGGDSVAVGATDRGGPEPAGPAARDKKKRRGAKARARADTLAEKCNVCGERFASRTKLFAHR